MPFFDDSYHTTAGAVNHTQKLETALRESFIKEGSTFPTLNVESVGDYKPGFITGFRESESEIPLFTHPIMIKNIGTVNYLITDLRYYIRKNNEGAVEASSAVVNQNVKNKTEFNFAKTRAVLNLVWLNRGADEIKNTLGFAGIVFSTWIAEAISKAYALDYNDQLKIQVLASFYYQSLFIDDRLFDEDTRQKMAIHTIKAARVNPSYIDDIFKQIEAMDNIHDFCEYVKKITENVRLQHFNFAMLLTIIRNSWYGTNSKEVISVALEHPPTWIAVVYTALNEKSYKSSMIYRIAERQSKNGASHEFNKAFTSLVQTRITHVGLEDLSDHPALNEFH
jgi:hypothetical protein